MKKQQYFFHRSRFVAPLVAIASLMGCQLPPPESSLVNAELQQNGHVKKASRCELQLVAYSDHRRSKSMTTSAFTITADDVEAWVNKAVYAESHRNETVLESQRPSQGIMLTLEKAYVQTFNGKIAANIVFDARFRGENENNFGPARSFRGIGLSDGVDLSRDRVSEAFQDAIEQAFDRISATYQAQLCVAQL